MPKKRKASRVSVSFVPPGANTSTTQEEAPFGSHLDKSFTIPKSLRDVSAKYVEAINDWHFSMVNDVGRNQFYEDCMRNVIHSGSRVLDIGTGTGILAIIAARLGCQWVVTVEANRSMADLARSIIDQNKFSSKITVLHKLSTELSITDFPNKKKPNVLISEIFGTLMLGEGAHDYIFDARERLLTKPCRVIPLWGRQLATLIECPTLHSVSSANSWSGIALNGLNTFRDTVNMIHSKQLGFRMKDVAYTTLSEPVCLLDVNFESFHPVELPFKVVAKVQTKQKGVVHAVLLTWECFGHHVDNGVCLALSTHPHESNFHRDMAWGQGLQLVADRRSGPVPIPLSVQRGDMLNMVARFAKGKANMQIELNCHPVTQRHRRQGRTCH